VNILTMGLDLSLTATGVVVRKNSTIQAAQELNPPKEVGTGYARLSWLRSAIVELVREHHVCHIAVEDYVRGMGHSAHKTPELGGVIRLALLEYGCALWTVPPTTLKKLATGKGNAPKDVVIKSVLKRWGYDTDSNNIADAFVLAVSLESYVSRTWDRKDDEKTWAKTTRIDPIVRRQWRRRRAS
jgi:crossover junction endodeoxyribonuclease RuvC